MHVLKPPDRARICCTRTARRRQAMFRSRYLDERSSCRSRA